MPVTRVSKGTGAGPFAYAMLGAAITFILVFSWKLRKASPILAAEQSNRSEVPNLRRLVSEGNRLDASTRATKEGQARSMVA